MPQPIIEVENLSKLYHLGVIGATTLKDSLERWWMRLSGKESRHPMLASAHGKGTPRTIQAPSEPAAFWALKNVSFTVNQGQIVGIIGRNGAGKSTLLKILSRITEPTEGKAILRGKVSSLLEVGTGFHQELTGRENIYLNGAILGMRKNEIDRKFDEIVGFAEIDKFIDTPVKHYSSGMYVRLAFAVAAHLEPEILLIDEVLAVGDVAFQKKCLGKIGQVAKGGRTVLFVSHNLGTITQLCNSTLWLDLGKIVRNGETQSVVNSYLSSHKNNLAEITWSLETAPGSELARLCSVRVCSQTGETQNDFSMLEDIIIEMKFWCLAHNVRLNPTFHVFNALGECIFATSNVTDAKTSAMMYEQALYVTRCTIPKHLLNEGVYYVSVYVFKDLRHHNYPIMKLEAVTFSVYDTGETRGDYAGPWWGLIRPLLAWEIKKAE